MFDIDSLAGNWDELAERLDRSQTLIRWSKNEPALHGLTEVEQILCLTQQGCDAAFADEIVGALVRLAAATGDGADDALLLLLHLLSDMVLTLANDLIDLSEDVLQVIVDELTCQICILDPTQPVRGWALTLKWATRRAVLAEFRPGLRRNHPGTGEFAVDADHIVWTLPHIGGAPPELSVGAEDDLDVIDLLLWAVRSGVATEDLSLLAATEAARAAGRRQADQAVATEFGVGVATLYRRNNRTLTALRRCGADYLAAVA